MIFYLDAHSTKCASFYAVPHLVTAAKEAIQALSDATRVLTDECRILSMERKMKDTRAEVKDAKHWEALERNIPVPLVDDDTPIVRWMIESQDAWDWMLEFLSDTLNELRSWTNEGPPQHIVDAAAWLRVHAPRPVTVGRVLPRELVFPLPAHAPKAYITSDFHAGNVPFTTKRDIAVRVFRIMYYEKYRNSVHYTKMRKPWWWLSLENSLDRTSLA